MTELSLIPEPRANFSLLGHERAEKALLDVWKSGRMPHGWLITGQSGVGKATLAFRMARFVLSRPSQSTVSLAISQDHPVSRLVASGGHPDLLVIERQKDEKKGTLKAGISVDEVRRVNSFLRMTSAEDGWRVVIVDEADAMNVNAQNALLKILEEPPPRTLLILTAESVGSMLVTVRSRVRRLTLVSLKDSIVQGLLQQFMPDLDVSLAETVVALAEGSIGRALAFAESDKLELYKEMVSLLQNYPHLDYKNLHVWSDKFSLSSAQEKFSIMAGLFTSWLVKLMQCGIKGEVKEIFPGEKDVFQRLLKKRPINFWVDKTEEVQALLEQGEVAHLDRKQLWMKVFFTLCEGSGTTLLAS